MHSFKENVLIMDSGEQVGFGVDIKEILDIGGTVAVRLKVVGNSDDIYNIRGVIDGKIAWQVQDMREYNPAFEPPSPYTLIRVYEKDPSLIIATAFDGGRFLINPLNGKIVGTESWVK